MKLPHELPVRKGKIIDALQRFFFIFSPLFLLLIDYLIFPVMFQAHQTAREANLVELLSRQTLLLGTYRGHRIHVSIDDIRDSHYLSHVKNNKNALVISVFIDSSGSPIGGPLQWAVKEKLEATSPGDYRKFVDMSKENRNFSGGRVFSFPLNVPQTRYHLFPLDHLFLLTFEHSANVGDLEMGITEILRLAEKEDISNLILPCLGLYWEKYGSLTFYDFFDSFFHNVSVSSKPSDIYLSLYTQWPSFFLEEAIESLNSSWDHNFSKFADRTPTLYRRDFRLTLLFMSLCLCVCSFHVTPSLKNFVVIGTSFFGVALGVNESIHAFDQDYTPLARSTLQVLALTVLAVGFRFIVNWNPQQIFKRSEK